MLKISLIFLAFIAFFVLILKVAQGRSKKVLKMKMQSKTNILKKIDHLIDYSKTSPFVQDKETKEILLNKLLDARRLWEEKDWEEIKASLE